MRNRGVIIVGIVIIGLILLTVWDSRGDVSSTEDYEEVSERSKPLSKFVFGVTGVYVNYHTLENEQGLSINDNRMLMGFTIGVSIRGVMVSFTYAYKVFPVNDSKFREFRVMDYLDLYMLESGYVFTIEDKYFYLGPVLGLSIDSSTLKLFNDFDFENFMLGGNVKDITSKTLSLGVGVKAIGLRNIMASVYYFYAFPNVYSYEGVEIRNSVIFKPEGFRVFLNLCL